MKAALYVISLSLGSLAAAKACGQPERASLADFCTTPVPPVEGARIAPSVEGSRMPGPVFSLVVPPGFAPLDVHGIDSKVGAWADSAGHVISYDYGAG